MRTIYYKERTNKDNTLKLHLDLQSEEIENVIERYLLEFPGNKISHKQLFDHIFDEYEVTSLNDFNDNTFLNQFYYLNNIIPKRGISGLISFYMFLIQNSYGNFLDLTTDLLMYKDLRSCLIDGYSIYKYSVYDSTPQKNKLIIDISSTLDVSNNYSKRIIRFDNTIFKNWTIRESYRYFFFNYSEDFALKNSKDSYLKNFLMLLDESIDPSSSVNVTVSIINEYKLTLVEKGLSNPSKGVVLSRIKTFLRFVSGKFDFNIDENVFLFLKTFDVRSQGDLRAYSKIELDMIIDLIDNKYIKTNYLYYFIIKKAIELQMYTPMRIATILGLTVDCVNEISNSSYEIRCHSKKTKQDKFNITKSVKTLVDEVIETTNGYRTTASETLKKMVFIYPKEKGKKITCLSSLMYSNTINELSKELNINELGATGIRNFYNSSLTQYAIKNGNGKELISQLSKHSINVHMNYYDNNDFYTLCEDYYDVKIGDLNFNGTITADYDSNGKDTVQNGCGFCTKTTCTDHTCFDCLMCRNFVTTLANIPVFEEEINCINELIHKEKIEHEKEFLISKKRLLVAYLTKLLELKQEAGKNE